MYQCIIGLLLQEAWFELVLLRSDTVNDLMGGFSGLLAGAVMTFFGEAPHNMMRSGISLMLQDGTRHHLFMAMKIVLADEGTLHLGYACKGASGLKPCMLCANISNYNEIRDIVARDTAGVAQHHVTHDASKLKFHTTESIIAIVRQLEAAHGTMGVGAFAELETRLGWNYVPGGIMYNTITRSLMDPVSIAMYDWMHIIFVSGVFGVNMGQVMWKLKDHGVSYAKLHEYLQHFTWPRFLRSVSGKDTCTPKRARSSWNDVTYKATASESLSVFPVFANYFSEFIHGVAPAPSNFAKGVVANLLQLVRVVELILKSYRCNVPPVQLQAAIKDYMQGYAKLHSLDTMIIKFHFLLHLPGFLKKYGFLQNCFVHERKHKLPKRFANHNTNITSEWDTSLIRDVTCHHLSSLHDDDGRFEVKSSLIGAHDAPSTVRTALEAQFGPGNYKVASAARGPTYEKFSVHDVVYYHEAASHSDGTASHLAGKVGMLMSAEVHGETIPVVLMEGYAHVRRTSRGDEWRASGMMKVCHLDAIVGAVIYRSLGDDGILTLTPLWLR